MNEAETRAEYIDPKLKASGWGVVEGTKVLREYQITAGKIQTGGGRAKPLVADYALIYRGHKLAVIEAKSDELEVGEGVAQAKNYAEMLHLDRAYSSNGKEIYQICMKTGKEGAIAAFPSPDELWNKTFATQNQWEDKFNQVPFEDIGGTKDVRYYQEIAVNNAMEAIAEDKQRILLTLATGTGKTFVAFQIAWKLFQTRWNLRRDGSRRPRILFLTDRNILADQAFNAFSAFPEDALARIKPREIRRNGRVPTSGSIFFTIFQTFMSGKDKDGNPAPYFGQYPNDYFDFIIIDECHRGGANDESNWRGIMEYFSPAVQLGLTATPKRKDNVDTYRYFGEPVYIYSLKEGINDGFLTPFKVKRIQTTIDDYIYTSDDQIIEGEIEQGKIYTEPDFNRIIEIKEREAKRVQIFLSEINQNEKAIVFCSTQNHALAVRDLVNQYKKSKEPNYCVRVTANDGALGEQYLREFQDNEKTTPTILTTSQKLSTGVDARNIRNIILMRPVNSMIEFKQIIGRGTRLFDGKDYFTIYDFVDAYHHFLDPEWDGEPIDETTEKEPKETKDTPESPEPPLPPKEKIKIKLRDGKEREIQHMISTSFWSANGKPISAEEFLQVMFGALPEFFKSEDELRKIWSNPNTRKTLLEKLANAGYGLDELATLQKMINAEKSDLFDVLDYISFAMKPITRELRVAQAQSKIFSGLDNKQKEFLEFVLSKYIETGVEELDQEKLPDLLTLKYQAISDAEEILGGVENIRNTFIDFQKYLYEKVSLVKGNGFILK
ncbi:MAG: DEAD/DEAH box helicase family protein [Omnitrophica bacterium]|nr:DEAD/DEAH box helicase family protein [Candidatus Omnitrophota bacterium]